MKLRCAMIGGALDSFIGPVHRIAATIDGQADLVAGAFSRNAEKNARTAEMWNVSPDRTYQDWRELLGKEADNLDYVIVATPNNTHVEITRKAVDAGLAVACDKPLGINLKEVQELQRHVANADVPVMVTYNYTGYPMVKEARALCADGALGAIHRIVVEMPQGWLQGMVTLAGKEPSLWRMDPKVAGPSLAIADVGTHALHLAEFVTGAQATHLNVDTAALLRSTELENDVNMLLRFDTGAKGSLSVSEFATGERNPFRLRVYGTKAGIEWMQEQPERLIVKEPAGTERHLIRGHSPDAVSTRWSRIPIGHPEGYLEAFGNLYQEFHRAVRDHQAGRTGTYEYPGVGDGVRGLAFVEAAVRSASATNTERWTAI
jgi:predicted dehydrogenase